MGSPLLESSPQLFRPTQPDDFTLPRLRWLVRLRWLAILGIFAAALLVLGGMPILVLAGLIEGTISQMHAPAVPYAAKLVFAVLVGAGLYAWLLFAGRRPD